MYKVMIKNRSFIVSENDVIKGGTPRTYPIGQNVRTEIELTPGKTIYQITDKCYNDIKAWEPQGDVTVIEHIKEGKKK